MTKVSVAIGILICMLGFTGCSISGVESDYPAAIIVQGEIYIFSSEPMPAEAAKSAVIGYSTSYTNTFPEKDGETNFSREVGLPYAKVVDGVAVLYDHEWHLCIPNNSYK